jgi:YlmC/YmxH family sporulation protein
VERIATLKNKDVINIRDGLRLGNVSDVVIDVKCGHVVSLIVPGQSCFFGLFGSDNEYVIGWSSVVKIGEDIILIDADLKDLLKKCEV